MCISHIHVYILSTHTHTHTCTHTHAHTHLLILSLIDGHHLVIVPDQLRIVGGLVRTGGHRLLWTRHCGVALRHPLGEASIENGDLLMAKCLQGGRQHRTAGSNTVSVCVGVSMLVCVGVSMFIAESLDRARDHITQRWVHDPLHLVPSA